MRCGRAGAASLACGLALLSLASCAAQFPKRPTTIPPAGDATSLLAKSVVASGGNPYEMYRDVAVSYRGEWGTMVQFLQPVLTDGDYRGGSEERFLLEEGVVAQVHEGAAGRKVVLRDPDGVIVAYDGKRSTDRDVEETSALVADGYAMFLLGAAWLERHGEDWVLLADETEDGRRYRRLLGRLRPGVGLSEEDRVVAWIDAETDLLYRVHFTLEGHLYTQGAHVDVTFSERRKAYGRLWPTHFVERVKSPVDIHAHEWWMIGLDVDRGLRREDLGRPAEKAWSSLAEESARPLGDDPS